MKLSKKIAAFTLNEMIVVLIITAILVSLAFSVLTLTQKQLYGIQHNYLKNDELRKLEQILWIDFNRYSTISLNSNTNELLMENNIASVHYKFSDHYILRNTDTIPITTAAVKTYIDGQEIQNGIIDAIRITLDNDNPSSTLFIYSRKDAAYYMQLTKQNGL